MLWKLPYRCHNNLLHLICDDLDIDVQLHKRFLKFFHQIIHCSNTVVRTFANLAVSGSRSSVCRSLNYILSKYGIPKATLPSSSLNTLLTIMMQGLQLTPPDVSRTSYMVRELCLMRDGSLTGNLSGAECSEIIAHLCTE